MNEYRDQLAAERGISEQDRDLLMTGADEETLLRQADLLEPLPDRTKGNRAPREGRFVRVSDDNSSMREFTRELLDGSDNILDH